MDATLNVYSIVLLVGIVQCVVAAAALAVRAGRARRRADGWLAAVLVGIALANTPYLLGFMGLYDRVAWLSNLPIANAAVMGPLALGYVWAVAEPSRRVPRWIFVPAALCLGVGLWTWARTTTGTPYDQTAGPALTPLLDVLGLATNVACLGAAVQVVRVLRQRPARTAADAIAARWLPRAVGALAAGVAIGFAFSLAYALGVPFAYTTQWWAHLAYTVVGYFVAVAGWGVAERMDEVAADVSAPSGPPPLSEAEVAAWTPRLDAWMRETRPHLRPDLTLAALADEVGLAPAALSHAVNTGLGKNFNEFVNGYRVAEVQARLRQPDAEGLTLLAVAEECGFASKATFNRAFRKETGTTPSAWWGAQREGRRSSSETSQAAI